MFSSTQNYPATPETPDTPPLASDHTIAPHSRRQSVAPEQGSDCQVVSPFDASLASTRQMPRLPPSPVIPAKKGTSSHKADDVPSDDSELVSVVPSKKHHVNQKAASRDAHHQRQEPSLKVPMRPACFAFVGLLCFVAVLSASNTADGISANVSLTFEANVTLSKREHIHAVPLTSLNAMPRSSATAPQPHTASNPTQSWKAPPKEQRVVSGETKSAVFAPLTKDSFDPSKVAPELLAPSSLSSVHQSFDYFYVPRVVKDPSVKFPKGTRPSCRFVNKKGSKQVSKFRHTAVPPGGCGAAFNLTSDLHLPPPVTWQNVLRNKATFSSGLPADSVTYFRKWLDGQPINTTRGLAHKTKKRHASRATGSSTSTSTVEKGFDVCNVNVRPLASLPECPFGQAPHKTIEPDASPYAQDAYQMALFFSTVAADAGWAVVPVAGTGLGALRHGGMLPGDDDLDVNLYPPLWVVERTAQFEDAGLAWTFIYDAFDDLIIRHRSEKAQPVDSSHPTSSGSNDYNDRNARPFNWHRTSFGPLSANGHPAVHPLVYFKSDAAFKGKHAKPCAAHYLRDEAREERKMFFGGCMPPHFFICLQAPQFFYTPARSVPFSFPLIPRGMDYLKVVEQHAAGKSLTVVPKKDALSSSTPSARTNTSTIIEHVTILLSVKQAVRPTPAFYTSFALRPTGPMCRCQFMPHGDTRATAPWMVCPAALPSFVRKWYGERWCIPAGAVETGAAAVLKAWDD